MGERDEAPQLRRYFTDLDGMRGVLAVAVMLYHLGLNRIVEALTRGLVPFGAWGLCVDFFFVLSGFVLYFSIERTRPRLTRYFTKRVRRLAPAFMIATLATLLLDATKPPIAVVLANLTIVQSLLHVESIDFPAWSIPFELFLPALVLPIIRALSRAGLRPALAIAALLAATAAAFALLLASGIDVQFGRALFGLALGMTMGRVRQHAKPGPDRPRLVLALFASAILIMALGGRLPALAILFAPISALCIFWGTQTRTFLSSAPFQAIGRWSYSIYLLHIPVLMIVQITLGRVDGDAPRKLLVVVLTIVAAAAMFRFVERPLMNGSKAPAQTAP